MPHIAMLMDYYARRQAGRDEYEPEETGKADHTEDSQNGSRNRPVIASDGCNRQFPPGQDEKYAGQAFRQLRTDRQNKELKEKPQGSAGIANRKTTQV
jgi:hypothetical protein